MVSGSMACSLQDVFFISVVSWNLFEFSHVVCPFNLTGCRRLSVHLDAQVLDHYQYPVQQQKSCFLSPIILVTLLCCFVEFVSAKSCRFLCTASNAWMSLITLDVWVPSTICPLTSYYTLFKSTKSVGIMWLIFMHT